MEQFQKNENGIKNKKDTSMGVGGDLCSNDGHTTIMRSNNDQTELSETEILGQQNFEFAIQNVKDNNSQQPPIKVLNSNIHDNSESSGDNESNIEDNYGMDDGDQDKDSNYNRRQTDILDDLAEGIQTPVINGNKKQKLRRLHFQM